MSEQLPSESHSLTSQKSILDDIPVEDKAFPLHPHSSKPPIRSSMGVVGNCPSCAAPVYGHAFILEGDPPPAVIFSCSCRTNAQTQLGRVGLK